MARQGVMRGGRDVDLTGKCGSCAFYLPVVKERWGERIVMARGACHRPGIEKSVYKCRTESCKSYRKARPINSITPSYGV